MSPVLAVLVVFAVDSHRGSRAALSTSRPQPCRSGGQRCDAHRQSGG